MQVTNINEDGFRTLNFPVDLKFERLDGHEGKTKLYRWSLGRCAAWRAATGSKKKEKWFGEKSMSASA